MSRVIDYTPEPTAARFHADNSFFRVLKGPVGSGKSVTCTMDLRIRSAMQQPFNGIRKSRWLIVRDTYPNLKATTIKTFKDWIPPEICHLSGDIPIHGMLKHSLPDKTKIEAEFYFMALDRPEDVEKLLSLEITGAWLNEASKLDEEIFKYLRGRVGRYPSIMEGGASWCGIMADTNPPKTTHWIYRLFEEENWPEFKIFSNPPAVYFDVQEQKWIPSPDAENLRWLKPNYYHQQIAGNTDDYIRVMLAGEYGMTREGKPVFPQFSEREHVAKEELKADRGIPLIIGFDFGLHPAAVFAQVTHRGGLVLLDSLSPADESLEDFTDKYVLPLINKKYPGFRIQCVGDPAGRGRSGLDKRTPFDVLGNRGLRCVPAPSNSFPVRKEAVDFFLNKIDGLKVNPHLTQVRNGFGGGYVYGEIKGTKNMTKELPDKNEYSHAMDAIQYIALHVRRSSGARDGRRSFATERKEEKFLWA